MLITLFVVGCVKNVILVLENLEMISMELKELLKI